MIRDPMWLRFAFDWRILPSLAAAAMLLMSVSIAAADPDAAPSPADSPSPTTTSALEPSSDYGAAIVPSLWYSLEEEVSPSYDGLSGSSTTLNLRAQIPLGPNYPFQKLQLPGMHKLQLIKLKVPFVTSAPATAITGNGDTTVVELAYLGTKQRQWVIGPAFKLPTASQTSLGSGKWSLGPAAGYTFTFARGSSAIGLYTQNFFSFAGPKSLPNVARTQLQPTFFVTSARGWIVGTSQMQFTYDWQRNQWPDVPLGIRIARNFQTGSGRLTAGFEMEKNLVYAQGSPGWTLRLNFKYQVQR